MVKKAKNVEHAPSESTDTIESLRAEVAELRAALAAARPDGSDYVPERYPAMRYHADGRTATVADEVADQELGEGWYDAPQASGTAYPAWRYHPQYEPRMVKNADDDAALGTGWTKPEDLS